MPHITHIYIYIYNQHRFLEHWFFSPGPRTKASDQRTVVSSAWGALGRAPLDGWLRRFLYRLDTFRIAFSWCIIPMTMVYGIYHIISIDTYRHYGLWMFMVDINQDRVQLFYSSNITRTYGRYICSIL